MKYSISFKKSVLRKVLPPNNESIPAVAKEMGITSASIYVWIKKAKNSNLLKDGELPVNRRGANEKLRLVLEEKKVSDEKKGEWLRQNGLHTEHIHQFEQEIKDIVVDKNQQTKEELRKLKSENKDLKKDLRKKEKALAEMAALIILKKKADAIWGDNEED